MECDYKIERGKLKRVKTKEARTSNTSGFTSDEIAAIMKETPLLGWFRNNWRGRNVYIYAHPTDPNKVVTVGKAQGPQFTTAICSEERSAYASRIDNNDWSDYN